jgi:histidinol phosphatase-like PHP family hydrolase
MERTCAHAQRIGLPALVFTEHLDITGWTAVPEDFPEHERHLIDEQGLMQPPLLDVDGYLAGIEHCRRHFPDLQILTGVELGQPHLDGQAAGRLLDLTSLDRVNGSLHNLPHRGGRSEPVTLFRELTDPAAVIWMYLAEVPAMVDGGDFEVFTHLDYAVRHWPGEEHGPFDPRVFEDGFSAGDAVDRQQRPCSGDEHRAPSAALDSAMVVRGGRACRELRQRRPQHGRVGGELPRGHGSAGARRVQSRSTPDRFLDQVAEPAAASTAARGRLAWRDAVDRRVRTEPPEVGARPG